MKLKRIMITTYIIKSMDAKDRFINYGKIDLKI
jgi:hypothetical protein